MMENEPIIGTSDVSKMIGMGLGSDADNIVCVDGFKIRCQAGPLYESLPELSSIGPWTHLEVEDISGSDDRLTPYLGFKYLYETGFYRYFRVPVETIRSIMDDHGGLGQVYVVPGKPIKLKTFLILESLGYRGLSLTHPRYKKTGLKWGE